MKTITIQIGNSDDRLTQAEWASYVIEVDIEIEDSHCHKHFFGAPPNFEMWQNTCWVIEFMGDMSMWISSFVKLKEKLTKIRTKYKQDSLAWTEGETEFI